VTPQLTSVLNFRDVGGLTTDDGRQLVSGRLFRSASLQEICAPDADVLVGEFGVRYLVDLRTAREAAEEGRGRLVDYELNYLNLPLANVDAPPPQGHPLLAQYELYLDAAAGLPVIIETVAGLLRHPTLIHCAAGKDRTGVVLAMIELLAGVSAEQVVADYMRTAPGFDTVVAQLRSWPRYARHMQVLPPVIYQCQEPVIRSWLATLQARHGGARAWALAHGVPRAALDQLRDALVIDR
jgi:hypothetical protein